MTAASSTWTRPGLGPWLAVAPLLLLLGLTFGLPVARILAMSFGPDGFTLEKYGKALGSAVYLRIYFNTFAIALLVTACCAAASYPLAWVMATSPPGIAKVLVFVVLLPFWTSALVRTTAWIVILQRNGILNRLLLEAGIVEAPLSFLYNLSGVLIGMVHVLLPFMVFPVYAALRGIDPNLILAAQGLGAGRLAAWRRVILPLSLPGLAAGSLIVFASAVGYYITPSLMGGPGQTMIAQMISFHMLRQLDWGMASALATLLLLATLAIVLGFRRILGFDRLFGGTSPIRASGAGLPQSRTERTVAWLLALSVALFLVAPILLVFPLSVSSTPFLSFPPPAWTTGWYEKILADPKWLRAFWSSLQVAAMAIALAVATGTAAALGLARLPARWRGPIETVVVMPLIVPTIVVAIGLYYVLAPLGLHGSRAMLAVGHAALAAPFVVLTVRAALKNLDPNLELAARGLGAGTATVLRRIMLPVLAPGIAAGAVFAFITSFDDVVLALFLTDARSRTLPRVIYEGVTKDTDGTIVAIAAILVTFSLAALCASLFLGRRR